MNQNGKPGDKHQGHLADREFGEAAGFSLPTPQDCWKKQRLAGISA